MGVGVWNAMGVLDECCLVTVTRSVPKDSWDAAEARQVILTKRPTSF